MALAHCRRFETTSKSRFAAMQGDEAPDTSQLFLVRLWVDGEEGKDERSHEDETGSEGRAQVHGKVQHVLSGKASSFNNWQALVEHLFKMMPSRGSSQITNPLERKE
jgi:hypothetical protein